MMELGRRNLLPVLRRTAGGALLDGGGLGEILLPAAEAGPGEQLEVFLYMDHDGRPLATSTTPRAQVGEVACLSIRAVTDAGAFLDWGLPKDLLLPWSEVKREQKRLIVVGRKVLVAVFQAADNRIAASARLDDFLSDEAEDLKEGDRVTVLVAERTDLGLRVVVDHRYWGLVHANEVFGNLPRGHRQDGYVKALRPDRKLNIALSAPGYAKVDAAAERILEVLAARGGFLAVGDRTPPEKIHALFGMSKKAFKAALGGLYRGRRIRLEDAGIRLLPESE